MGESDRAEHVPRWLTWARELQSIAQNGLTYAKDPYDVARYERVRVLAAGMMVERSDADLQFVHGLFRGETGYATPKVDVRAVVCRGDELLLVRERSDGRWTLPGGWADPGESPGEAVAREVFEESGYEVRATRLLALYDRDRHGHPPLYSAVYKAYFACEVVAGEAKATDETDGVEFFAEHELPELSLSRVVPDDVHRLLALYRNPALPTDFD